MSYELLLGDCLKLLPTLTGIDAVITDPPWGIDLDTDYTRFVGSKHANNVHSSVALTRHTAIVGDDKPFDPSPFLAFPTVILWGMNHFSNHLPAGGVIVWLKKRGSQIGTFLSDAEVAWVKGIQGVYVYQHIWHGFDRDGERGEKVLHPTQKPVGLFKWCIDRYTKAGDTVFDPYMGSGSCGVAAMQTGRNFIGVEIDPAYHAIATKRIQDAAAQPMLLSVT